MSEPLSMWTVYNRPPGFPRSVVARRWLVTDEVTMTRDIIVGPDLQSVRAQLESMRLACLSRNEGDDPSIVETWL